MTPLKVVFLADTRPGHFHVAQGVIAALSRLRPVEVTRIEVKRKWIVPTRWLRRRINAKTFFPPRMLRMAYRIDADTLPKADLVVSAGGERGALPWRPKNRLTLRSVTKSDDKSTAQWPIR